MYYIKCDRLKTDLKTKFWAQFFMVNCRSSAYAKDRVVNKIKFQWWICIGRSLYYWYYWWVPATLFISHSYCVICIRPVKHVKFCPINVLFCPINVFDVKLRPWNNISTFVWLRFVFFANLAFFGIFRKTFD